MICLNFKIFLKNLCETYIKNPNWKTLQRRIYDLYIFNSNKNNNEVITEPL